MKSTKASDEYLTPAPIAALATKVLGHIDFDPYGHPNQHVKVRDMHTAKTGVSPWPGTGKWWANPPFSQGAEQIPRLAKWWASHKIDGLLLCLAAPSSAYWREAIWSPIGPQLIAWVPRMKFDQVDEGCVIPTEDGISRDLALCLWSDDSTIQARFRRLVGESFPKSREGYSVSVIAGGGR